MSYYLPFFINYILAPGRQRNRFHFDEKQKAERSRPIVHVQTVVFNGHTLFDSDVGILSRL